MVDNSFLILDPVIGFCTIICIKSIFFSYYDNNIILVLGPYFLKRSWFIYNKQ